MTDTPTLRRHPLQERGQRRIELILDAAEQVLAEVGLDVATTNAIAARARTSIGSLYQFFPNKEAIIQALLLRCATRMYTFRETLLTPETASSLTPSAWIERVVDALAAMQAASPSFQVLFCLPADRTAMPAKDHELARQISIGVEEVFACWSPEMLADRRALLAEISITVVQALLPLIPRTQDERRDAVLQEIKDILRRYLQPYFGYPEATDLAPTV